MLTQIKHLILDMDGVLWRGETPIVNLPDFFATLQTLGIDFALATNNATKVAAQYVERLAGFGVTAVAQQIVTSAEATAGYLRQEYDAGTAVYVIGETGLKNALRTQGFHIIEPESVTAIQTVPLVVTGFNRNVTYKDLAMGALYIHRGARFIGTNPDVSFPSEVGPLPGAGALLAMISTATGVKPTIIGKPGPIMFQQAMQRLGGTPENTAMVGDRLTTDIAGGKAANITTILVLSGITQPADLETSEIQPDYVFADIDELTAVLHSHQQQVAITYD